jgi:hypothetical protein
VAGMLNSGVTVLGQSEVLTILCIRLNIYLTFYVYYIQIKM